MGGYSRGQRAKFAANNTALKVYSRVDAEAVINAIMDERLPTANTASSRVKTGRLSYIIFSNSTRSNY